MRTEVGSLGSFAMDPCWDVRLGFDPVRTQCSALRMAWDADLPPSWEGSLKQDCGQRRTCWALAAQTKPAIAQGACCPHRCSLKPSPCASSFWTGSSSGSRPRRQERAGQPQGSLLQQGHRRAPDEGAQLEEVRVAAQLQILPGPLELCCTCTSKS